MIDGVEDPFNFGAAVRSLYAAGATMALSCVLATGCRLLRWLPERLRARLSGWPRRWRKRRKTRRVFFKERGLLVACATDAPPTNGALCRRSDAPAVSLNRRRKARCHAVVSGQGGPAAAHSVWPDRCILTGNGGGRRRSVVRDPAAAANSLIPNPSSDPTAATGTRCPVADDSIAAKTIARLLILS